MQVLIGIPTHDSIKRDTVGSLFSALAFFSEGIAYKLNLPAGAFIHQNRNHIVLEGLKHKADYVMFIDSDMKFPPESIAKLISRDKDIIAAKANRRKLPLQNNIKMLADQGGYYTPTEDELSKEPFLLKGIIGCAFMLVKIEVFQKIKEPWFSFSRLESIDDFDGEDAYFCMEAQKAGFQIWCDPTIEIGHIGEYVY